MVIDDEINSIDDYHHEIYKDKVDIARDKQKFIKEMTQGLGKEVNNFNNYVKKPPSRWKKFWNKVNRILWRE
jgi:hypothetical protein